MDFNKLLKDYFSVLGSGKAYLTLVYHFLAFPLGIFYFIYLITGFSISLSLFIVIIGIPVLMFMFLSCWFFALVERQSAIVLLGIEIGSMAPASVPEDDFWARIKKYISNPVTWKAIVFLFLKFPLGILSFIVLTTVFAINITFVAAPIILMETDSAISIFLTSNVVLDLGGVAGAFVLFCLGILLWPLSMHISNGLGFINAFFAQVLLGEYPITGTQKPSIAAQPAVSVAASVSVSSQSKEEPAEDQDSNFDMIEEMEKKAEPEIHNKEIVPESLSQQKVLLKGALVNEAFEVRTISRKVSEIQRTLEGGLKGQINYKGIDLVVHQNPGEENWFS
ncbi:MAG: sensor domain-containing protein [Anaerolineales bacterium]|nr:sensor domain-containing protein [Anaerolineales bacterium]